MVLPLASVSTLPFSIQMPQPSVNMNDGFFIGHSQEPKSFMELLAEVGKSTRDSLKKTEGLAKLAARGEADPQQVALQVVNTKTTLHQLSSLINTSIQSYQEIMRTGV